MAKPGWKVTENETSSRDFKALCRRASLLGALIFDDFLICGLLLWQNRKFALYSLAGYRSSITPPPNWMPVQEIFDKFTIVAALSLLDNGLDEVSIPNDRGRYVQ